MRGDIADVIARDNATVKSVRRSGAGYGVGAPIGVEEWNPWRRGKESPSY